MNEQGFVWSVRVRPASEGRAHASVRRRQVVIGPPLTFDPEYEEVTALEQFMAAFGAEVVLGLLRAAGRRRIPIDEAETLVRCELNNPLVHLGVVGEGGHAGIERLDARVFISSPEEPNTVIALWEELREQLPLYRTLINAVPHLAVTIVVTA